MWPASAMLTGSGVALILRVPGTPSDEPWSTYSWYVFAAVAAFSLLTKYVIRYRGSHIFNPSNIGLVIAFIVLGETLSNHSTSGGPLSTPGCSPPTRSSSWAAS